MRSYTTSSKNKFRYRVVTLSMGYYILFDYVHVFYVLLFTRYSCNIANVCAKHQSINQSMIYYYLLLTKRKYMHNISVRQCIHLRTECILLKNALKMYFGQRFHTPMNLQKNAFKIENVLR
jgi:hypothetical protein